MARRFRFNLEAVLRHRERLEEDRRREFAEVNRLVEEERLRREEMQRERGELQDEIVKSFEEQAPFQSVVMSYHMVGRLEQAATESLKRQNILNAELEKRRQALVTARQETHMLETLKERRQEEFQREQDRLEQALLDELSIQARGRRLREEKAANGGE